MSPRARATRRQGGVALIVALFVIVVLAGLGLFAMRVGNGQQQSVTLDLLSARAEAAAAAGIEFGANQALRHGSCALAPPPLSLTQAALNGFSVQVSCSANTYLVKGVSYPVYAITATATRGVYGRPEYVSRRLSRTVNNIP